MLEVLLEDLSWDSVDERLVMVVVKLMKKPSEVFIQEGG